MIRGTKHALKRLDRRRNVELPMSLHNRFDIEVIDAATGRVRQKAQAENIICDALWSRMLSPAAYNNYIHYGTGTGTPAATDTSLCTFLGYGTPSTDDDVISAGTTWASIRRKIQLSETTAVGSTLTEVGIGYSTTAATLVTHAMLKDMNGNQISIEKTDTDIINIYATVFVHWAAAIDSGYIVVCDYQTYYKRLIKAVCGIESLATYACANAYTRIAGYDQSRAASSYCVNSTTRHIISTISKSYSVANKRLTLTVARLAVDVGNNGGLNEISIGDQQYYSSGSGCYVDEFSFKLRVGGSWYSGTSITGEAIGTGDGSTTDFAADFPFVSDATIYVDGVETTATVDENIPKTPADVGQYFELLPDYSTAVTFGAAYAEPFVSAPDIGADDYTYSTAAFFNPYYAKGLDSFIYSAPSSTGKVECSDDLATWVTITSGAASSAAVSIPTDYKNYKYWRLTRCGTTSWTSSGFTTNHIHFDTAPASGAAITGDYTTKTIAKDSDHVFDLTVTLTFAEQA